MIVLELILFTLQALSCALFTFLAVVNLKLERYFVFGFDLFVIAFNILFAAELIFRK